MDATLAEACRRAAEGFLESVVVIDDRAFRKPQGTAGIEPSSESPRVRRRPRSLKTPAREHGAAAMSPQEHDLDARELISVFAAKGMVCGVLSPEPNATDDLPMKAVQRADIVVLDWDLHGDTGDGALRIIEALWDKGDAPNRHRLVAVYTGDRDLPGIVNRITALLKRLGSSPVHRDGSFVRSKEMLRVAVFAKPYATFLRSEKAKRARVVRESELPERLIDEFAKLTYGLLPTVALMSLAAVRQNAHRIVSQLNATLDPAYLWHRAMLPNPTDAEDHLVDLVAAELHSVIENDGPGRGANLGAIRLWLQDQDLARIATQFGGFAVVKADDVLEVLEFGAEHQNPPGQWLGGRLGMRKNALDKKEIAAFARTLPEARRSDAEFARLLGLKTRYTNPPPRLWLGVIVAAGRGTTEQYWLCVQPRCDSVRLTGPTSFPMLPLSRVADGRKFDIVVPSPKGPQRLELSRKPADLKMIGFAPSLGQDSVIGLDAGGGGYRFRAATGRPTWYRFIAELKSDTSQAFALELASSISRVGPIESEWLRRWKAKGDRDRPATETRQPSSAEVGASTRTRIGRGGHPPAMNADVLPASHRPAVGRIDG